MRKTKVLPEKLDLSGSLDISEDLKILGHVSTKDKKDTENSESKKERKKISWKRDIKDKENEFKGKKRNEIIISIFLLFLVVISFVSVRIYASDFPVLHEFAKDKVETVYKQKITQDVETKYPIISDFEKNRLIKKEIRDTLKDDRVKQQLSDLSKMYKDFYKDMDGVPYLYSADGYFYLRRARNLEEMGNECFVDDNGVKWDKFRNAPAGSGCTSSLFPYLNHKFFNILNLLGYNEIARSQFLMPVLLGILAAIMIFIIARNIFGVWVGFIAAMFFSFSSKIFSVTKFGFSDNNPLNILLSLIVIYLYLKLIEMLSTKKSYLRWKSYLWLILLYLSMELFKYSWTGYFYIFFIIILHLFILITIRIMGILLSKNKKEKMMAGAALLVVVVIVSSLAFFVLNKTDYVERTRSRLLKTDNIDVYPSVFTSINELENLDLTRFMDVNGGVFVHIILVLGILLLMYAVYDSFMGSREEKNVKKEHTSFMISSNDEFNKLSLVLIWGLVLIIPAFASIRFYMFYLLPILIIIAFAIDKIIEYLSIHDWFGNMNLIKKTSIIFIVVLVMLSLLYPSTRADMDKLPIVDDSVEGAAQKILMDSGQDAIVNTWWDDGYFYQYFARRGTVADGGLFPGDKLYMLANAFTAKDENLAYNLLNLVDCGKSVSFDDMLVLDNISEKLADEITGCDSDIWVVISDGFIYKYNAIKQYADRDLKKVNLYNEIKNMEEEQAIRTIKEKLEVDDNEAKKINFELTTINPDIIQKPDNAFFSDKVACQKMNDEVFVCENNIYVNVTMRKGFDAQRKSFPIRYFRTGRNVTYLKSDDASTKYTFVIYEDDENSNIFAYFVRTDILDEMYVRLYLFDGFGLENFQKMFDFGKEVTQHVKVFKVKNKQSIEQ